MRTWKIKGSCENCGFAYKGTISAEGASFPDIKCPNCHKVTQNFDEAVEVDRFDKEEGSALDYKESVFKVGEEKNAQSRI
jgi:hypothetical protein